MTCEGARDLRTSARPEDQAGLQSTILAVQNKPLTLAYREPPLLSCWVPLLGQLTVHKAGRPAATQGPVAGTVQGHMAMRLRRLGSVPSQAGQ